MTRRANRVIKYRFKTRWDRITCITNSPHDSNRLKPIVFISLIPEITINEEYFTVDTAINLIHPF